MYGSTSRQCFEFVGGIRSRSAYGRSLDVIVVLQRVTAASVSSGAEVLGRIGHGLLLLVAVCEGDRDEEMHFLMDKIAELRIFSDEEGRMNRSVEDVGGEILLISQFTLCADWVRGRRPGFSKAAEPALAEAVIDAAVKRLRDRGIPVQTGRFGAHMDVSLTNDGPVTLILDSREKFKT